MGSYTMFEDLNFNYSLGSDNHAGVHPRVLEAMSAANRGHAHAYGMDEVCVRADREFRRLFGENVEAQYVFTGTAANVLSLAGLLKSYQAVICSDVAHLQVDECGAPEKFLGSKLYTLPSTDGKIFPDQCEHLLVRRGDQHFAQPRVVTLTQPNELGVCYTLEELRAWKKFCLQQNLMLHVDGARLPNAAAFLGAGLRELTDGADVVSFGGTKNGLMGVEAVLLCSEQAKSGFKFHRKQAMQLSSKTRFLAAQFYAFLADDLWLEIARHTTGLARDLERKMRVFPEVHVDYPVESNAIFARLPQSWIKPMRERFFFYVWDARKSLCRWMISWDWSLALNDKVISALHEVKNAAH
jgi:threonine aldolase